MMEELEKDMRPKLLGETFKKYPTEKSKQKSIYGRYQCQYCNEEFEAIIYNVRKGYTKSCGCQKASNDWIIHGLHKNKFYSTWAHMMSYCFNPKFHQYEEYGGRGITVCEEWLDIRNFIEWADVTFPNTSDVNLNRINTNGNYSPENCRWATKTEQNINQRMKRSNTSGYVGVCFDKWHDRWVSQISFNCKNVRLGRFLTKEEAVEARDNYIIENNLPHKLSTDYK